MLKRIAAVTAALLALPAAVALSFSAFWRRTPKDQEKAWTGPFSASDYRTFVALVREHFRRQDLEVDVQDGQVTIVGHESAGRWGLENLAQKCAVVDRREWPAIITGHFASLQRAEAERQAVGSARTFAEALPLLAVRLWPADFVDQVGAEHAIYREELPGTVTVLVYDLPETIQQVRPEEAAAWGKSTDELFALGLDNLRRKPRPQIQRAALPDGMKVTVFSGNSFFVASEALRLDQFPGCTGRGGALVGVPTRHVLIAYPVEDMSALKAMPVLVPIIVGMFSKGPGSISPRLYWYHDGKYTDLPYTIEANRARLSPPEAFVALLKGLGPS